MTETTFYVGTQTDLDAAIETIDSTTTHSTTTPGTYTITLPANITETTPAPGLYVLSLAPGVSVDIDGASHTISGEGFSQPFFGGLAVTTGTVSISDLTLQDTLARGAAGQDGGGGGAGLGGGLFVGPDAKVSLSGVQFIDDATKGAAAVPPARAAAWARRAPVPTLPAAMVPMARVPARAGTAATAGRVSHRPRWMPTTAPVTAAMEARAAWAASAISARVVAVAAPAARAVAPGRPMPASAAPARLGPAAAADRPVLAGSVEARARRAPPAITVLRPNPAIPAARCSVARAEAAWGGRAERSSSPMAASSRSMAG